MVQADAAAQANALRAALDSLKLAGPLVPGDRMNACRNDIVVPCFFMRSQSTPLL